MAQFKQLGSPTECKTTSPAITIADIVDLEFSFDPDLAEHFGGSQRFPRYTIGNDNTTVTLRTTDVAALGWHKGLEATALSVTYAATISAISAIGAQGATLTQDAGTIIFTISNVRVVSATRVSNGAGGAPAEYQVTFRAAVVESTGAAPTLTFDVTV